MIGKERGLWEIGRTLKSKTPTPPVKSQSLDFLYREIYHTWMVNLVTEIGTSREVIFGKEFMDLAHLEIGDSITITLHDGGNITMTAAKATISTDRAAAAAKRLIGKNSELFRRLS